MSTKDVNETKKEAKQESIYDAPAFEVMAFNEVVRGGGSKSVDGGTSQFPF